MVIPTPETGTYLLLQEDGSQKEVTYDKVVVTGNVATEYEVFKRAKGDKELAEVLQKRITQYDGSGEVVKQTVQEYSERGTFLGTQTTNYATGTVRKIDQTANRAGPTPSAGPVNQVPLSPVGGVSPAPKSQSYLFNESTGKYEVSSAIQNKLFQANISQGFSPENASTAALYNTGLLANVRSGGIKISGGRFGVGATDVTTRANSPLQGGKSLVGGKPIAGSQAMKDLYSGQYDSPIGPTQNDRTNGTNDRAVSGRNSLRSVFDMGLSQGPFLTDKKTLNSFSPAERIAFSAGFSADILRGFAYDLPSTVIKGVAGQYKYIGQQSLQPGSLLSPLKPAGYKPTQAELGRAQSMTAFEQSPEAKAALFTEGLTFATIGLPTALSAAGFSSGTAGFLTEGALVAASVPAIISQGKETFKEPTGRNIGRLGFFALPAASFAKRLPARIKSSDIVTGLGAKELPAPEIFSTKTREFGGTETFPRATSVMDIRRQFEATRQNSLSGDIEVVTASQQALAVKDVTGASKKIIKSDGRIVEDPGIYVTPKGQGSSYFLGLGEQPYGNIGLSLLPDFGTPGRPSATVFTNLKGIVEPSRNSLLSPGYESVRLFEQSQAGKGLLVIPKRSFAAFDADIASTTGNRFGVRGGTNELQAVIPESTGFSRTNPSSFFGRMKGFDKFVTVKGKRVPVYEYTVDVSGDLSAKAARLNRQSFLARQALDYSYRAGTKQKVSPQYGFFQESASSSVTEPKGSLSSIKAMASSAIGLVKSSGLRIKTDYSTIGGTSRGSGTSSRRGGGSRRQPIGSGRSVNPPDYSSRYVPTYQPTYVPTGGGSSYVPTGSSRVTIPPFKQPPYTPPRPPFFNNREGKPRMNKTFLKPPTPKYKPSIIAASFKIKASKAPKNSTGFDVRPEIDSRKGTPSRSSRTAFGTVKRARIKKAKKPRL